MKIGIVGPKESKWNAKGKREAQTVIHSILCGQCALPYIQKGDRRVQLELVEWKQDDDIEWNEKFPKANGWRSNATLVSGHCPVGDEWRYCLDFGHSTNGGCWTKKYAKKIGKETHLIAIEG